MTLTKYQKFCYDRFGRITEEKVGDKLKKSLESAHIDIRPSAYLAQVWFNSVLVLLVSFVVFAIMVFMLFPSANIELGPALTVIFLLLPALLAAAVYAVSLSRPASMAKARGKRIDVHLAYALNFISAMSSSGVTPTEIFRSLSKQDIYGEIKEEAAWIYRDIAVLGADTITAIKANITRTPSQKLKEFLQGMTVTTTSGGSLKTYFMGKADQYLVENRQRQKQLMETLGIMAESYVTSAVAGVLLLLIVIPLMMIISGGWNSFFLYILIFMLVPLIHGGFAVVIKSMAQGA